MSDQQTNLLDEFLNEDNIDQVESPDDTLMASTDNDVDPELESNLENFIDDTKETSVEQSEDSNVEIVDAQSPGVNCLYLTVKKDYNLSIIKNKIKRAVKGSWRVAVSVFILNFLSSFL